MGARPVLPALNKAGEVVPVSISISNIDIRGERLSIAVIRDAAAIRAYLDKASADAESDALTGMGNRLSLSHRMQTALDAQHPFALLFLDLTKFKPFNDRYGHRLGDEILHLVAERIQGHVRGNDLAVRLGGDEFVILLDGMTDSDLLETRARAIAASISQPFQIDKISDTIGVNIGGALYPRDGGTEKELLMSADRNMYQAKESQETYWIDPNPGSNF
jgi:diguanylate cyclase (GGDEF)-like protein